MDLIPSNFYKKSDDIEVSEGDIILINVLFWNGVYDIKLTGDIVKIRNSNPNKIRPIIIYNVQNNIASYFAVSTDEKAYRSYKIEFDYSNCEIFKYCKIKFNKNAYIFLLTKDVKRNSKKTTVVAKFNFNVKRLLNYINDEKFVKEVTGNTLKFEDLFNRCGKCDKQYIMKIKKRIDDNGYHKNNSFY